MSRGVGGLLVIAGTLWAVDVSGPVLGLWFDTENGSLRRLEGLPGAARVGATIALPFRIASAWPSPDGWRVLCVEEGGRTAWLVAANGAIQKLPTTMTGITHAGWSRTGVAAAIYSEDEQAVQTILSVTDNPALGIRLQHPSMTEAVVALAVDDLGEDIVFASRPGDSEELWRTGAGGTALLNRVGKTAGLLYVSPNEVVFADEALSEIKRADLRTGSIELIAGESDGIRSPRGLRSWGQRLFVLNGDQTEAYLIDLGRGSDPQQIMLREGADRVVPVEQGKTLALYNTTGGNIWLLEWQSPEKLLFVPPPNGR